VVEGFGVIGEQVGVEQAGLDFFIYVVSGVGFVRVEEEAVGGDGFGPAVDEGDEFDAEGVVAGGGVQTGEAGEVLAEGVEGARGIPAAEVGAGGGQAGALAEAFEQVVVGDGEILRGDFVELALEIAAGEPDIAVIETLERLRGRGRRVCEGESAGGCECGCEEEDWCFGFCFHSRVVLMAAIPR